MATQTIVVVPTKERHIYLLSDGEGRSFLKPGEALDWIRKHHNGRTVLGFMGGAGSEFFVRIRGLGVPVQRVPMFLVQRVAVLEPKASPEDRAAALELTWDQNPEAFYEVGELDQTVVLIRELTRQRLNIQEFRKMATLQLHSALRTLEFVLPEEATEIVILLRKGLKDQFRKPKLREQIDGEFRRLETEVRLSSVEQAQIFAVRRFFSNPRFVLGAKEDEQELEKQISKLLLRLKIWQWVNGTSEVLPPIKGFGPAIGGAVIGETGDIRRFPTSNAFRTYARFHVSSEGKFPHRQKGEVSSYNRYLSRAVWLWSTDQVARYDHPWRSLYLWKKAQEMQAHPEPVAHEAATQKGREYVRYDFTLKHLDSRAKRWVGSQLLEYLWDLWQQVAAGNNPEDWYMKSRWPVYFAQAEQALAGGLQAYLDAEIPKRRRKDPKQEEQGEEEEEGEE